MWKYVALYYRKEVFFNSQVALPLLADWSKSNVESTDIGVVSAWANTAETSDGCQSIKK